MLVILRKPTGDSDGSGYPFSLDHSTMKNSRQWNVLRALEHEELSLGCQERMNEIHAFKAITWEYNVWNIIDNKISDVNRFQ